MSEIGLGVLEEHGYVKLNRGSQGNIVGVIKAMRDSGHGTDSVHVQKQ